MSTLTPTMMGNDQAFFQQRKAMLVYPVIIFPFVAALFWIFQGGKGERYLEEEAAVGKPGASGFNASVPSAKDGAIDGRSVDSPGYGKAAAGQVLSAFSNTRHDSIAQGLKAIPVSQTSQSTTAHASSLATTSLAATPATPRTSRTNAAAVSSGATQAGKSKGYYYHAPKTRPYYTGDASDQQLAAQLRNYETERTKPTPAVSANQPSGDVINSNPASDANKPSSIRVSENFAATRLTEPAGAENAFNTAPTEGSRRKAERAVLSSGNSYGSKKTVAWMIPVVVHEDQAIREGQQVKLRLLKEISADGIAIPANTILYATCQLSDDRLRLTVRSLQQGSQLIPLDLDVYDTDGSAGINVPGLAQSSQIGGQMRSSAIQGVNIPGVGGLANNVINSARLGASTSARNTTIRLRAGYNLFLKAQ